MDLALLILINSTLVITCPHPSLRGSLWLCRHCIIDQRGHLSSDLCSWLKGLFTFIGAYMTIISIHADP